MRRLIILLVILFFSALNTSCATFMKFGRHRAVTRPVVADDLADYPNYSDNLKEIIAKASALSRKNLNYRFGSASPRVGGMDCSGTLFYLLRSIKNVKVPRDSYGMYMWLLHAGVIHHVTAHSFYSPQFNALKPGDLLFWTGTYRTRRRPPITHVMLYLGKDHYGHPLMFGSSDGGIYRGMEMWGVSVFDFILPPPRDRRHFVAYGCIPHYTC